jgi:hypothetical protein
MNLLMVYVRSFTSMYNSTTKPLGNIVGAQDCIIVYKT